MFLGQAMESENKKKKVQLTMLIATNFLINSLTYLLYYPKPVLTLTHHNNYTFSLIKSFQTFSHTKLVKNQNLHSKVQFATKTCEIFLVKFKIQHQV